MAHSSFIVLDCRYYITSAFIFKVFFYESIPLSLEYSSLKQFRLSLEYSSLKQFRQSLWLTDIFLST